MKTDVLIAVLSWEDRFLIGLKNNMDVYNPSKVILFYYNNIKTELWKADHLFKAKELLKENLTLINLELKPELNWVVYRSVFETHCIGKNILVDISTMPRESIWVTLFNCKKYKCPTHFIYYKPQNYPSWISRDPDRPRLLYKMSGIAKLGTPTLLVITAGYDIQRLDNLIFNFEPKQTILFFQHTSDARNKANFDECKLLCKEKYNITMLYEYDAYDVELASNSIINKLQSIEPGTNSSYLENYNVILNSLGSKTSAITLFELWLKYPEMALSYIPSKEYNRDYSKGVSKVVFDKVDLDI
ncbi:hypothetical protein [Mucilaginibacter sp. UYCu711]|uniref:hypothetical protein n=1 Tax=Mucilaginibacter sp. UYCu711 TaxID=3156339 RepID=UPI003D23AECC